MSNDIQALPGWQIHTPNDGSNIGGVQPTNWGTFVGIPGPTQRVLYVEGPPYGTVECYLLVPLPVAPQFLMSFDLTVDAVSLKTLMLIETDLLYCTGTNKLNMSLQRRLDRANMIQVAGQDGNWVDTGILGQPLLPGAPSTQLINYGVGKKTFGIQAVGSQLVSPDLQQLTPVPSNWAKGALIQFQITIGTIGGKASIIIDNLSLA